MHACYPVRETTGIIGFATGAAKIAGRTSYGAAVAFADDGSTTSDGWTVLARDVAMADGKTSLTAKDFADCVANFAKYPHVPVTIEHADTALPYENPPHPWREPNGHVEALRVGKMSVTALDGSTRDAATLEGKPSYLEPAGADVKAGKWRAGSITILHDARDEETNTKLGAMLWSWSLTAHPRITGMPPVTNARRLRRDPEGKVVEAGYWYGMIENHDDLVCCLREIFDLPVTSTEAEVLAELAKLEALTGEDADADGIDVDHIVCQLRDALRLPALSTTTEVLAEVRKGLSTLPATSTETSHPTPSAITESTMKFLALVATFGIPFRGTTEEDAEKHLVALAHDGAAVRRTLNLSPEAPIAEAISGLQGHSARALAPETFAALGLKTTATAVEINARVASLATAEKTRLAADRAAHVDDVMTAHALPEPMRAALLHHADTDFEGFAKAYPRPTAEELSQRRQDGFRTFREVPRDNGSAPRSAAIGTTAGDVDALAKAIQDEAEDRGRPITYSEALRQVTEAP